MQQRLNYRKAAPAAYEALLALQTAVEKSGLEKPLIELIKIRASQINQCAYCIHMHTRDARKAGEREERIYLLDAWHESSYYTARERAALAWTEALTLLPDAGAPEDVYAEMTANFSETEIANVTFAITAINAWNRLSVGFNTQHPALPKSVEV